MPYLESFKPTPRFREDSEEVNVVADLFIPGTSMWDVQKVYRVMDDNSATRVLRLFCSMTGGEDALREILTPEGRFSVIAAYWALNENRFSGSNDPIWKKFGKLKSMKGTGY